MRVFVTGATGFIGLAVVSELIAAGHQVLGLCRSPEKEAALLAAGATVHRGSLEDLESLERGATQADGIIHTAFNHDFSKYLANCEDDRRVIEVLGSALADTGRPLIVTSAAGVIPAAQGQLATEDDPAPSASIVPRAASEEAAHAASRLGANVSLVRLAQIHDTTRQGLLTYVIATAREKGVSAYVGDGHQRWAAAHVLDTARLYRLALEKAMPDSVYHAVAEEGVALRDIAATIGQRLQLPIVSLDLEDADAHFGWLAGFMQENLAASSEKTRWQLGWNPTGPGLLADIERLEER